MFLAALAAALVAVAWIRLEEGPVARGDLALTLAFALAPVLAVARRRHPLAVSLVVAASVLAAAGAAFDVPLSDARPGERDFFGPVVSAAREGFLDFYDTPLPLDRGELPSMHSLVLFATFAFAAAAGMLLAARRALVSALVLLVAVGWPLTLLPGERPLLTGALTLAALLAVLFLLRERRGPARGPVQAAAAAVVVAVAATGAATSDAVAKSAFLRWQAWDLYDRPRDPVGVRYVWNSHYQGISFPQRKTVVFRVKVPGPRRNLYWRATTLDEYTGTGWRESLALGGAATVREIDAIAQDPLLPAEARDQEKWVRQDVTVGALADDHLIAAGQPVRWRPSPEAPVQDAKGEVVVLPQSLRQGQRYTVWSYVSDARPSALAAAPGLYPASLRTFLEVIPGIGVAPFGAAGRDEAMGRLFAGNADDFLLSSYAPVYRRAREVVGEARSPYAAAIALEAWFRSEGGFVYDEQPPPTGTEPPLVSFVLRTKRGYCQYYAGAMAVMLRLLGIPARVGAGFTSGTYDAGTRTWTVTDHNAHTWVEVYFPGYGWLPFDPTPGRGELAAAYSTASPAFDVRDAGPISGGSEVLDRIARAALEGREGAGFDILQGFGVGTTAADEEGGGAGLVALAVAVLAGGALALLGSKELVRRFRFRRRGPRAVAAACRRDAAGFLADQRLTVSESVTVGELGALVERKFVLDAGPFVRTVNAARFAPLPEADAAARRARRELATLRRGMRRQLGVGGRVRGAFSVRSLAR